MTNQNIFYNRLKEQIKLECKTFNRVERDLGYPRNSLNNYKQGIEPSGRRLLELANYFKVSPDYLIGDNDNSELDPLKEYFQSLGFKQKRKLYLICQVWATTQLSKIIENNNK